jgi:hypothetical protein
VVSSGGGGAPVPARASRGWEVVRVEQGVLLPLYRAEREGEGRGGGGVGARRPTINGGGGRLGAVPVTGRGRAEAA